MAAPFFIVGCGRSGTTQLRTMLDQHPQIGVPLESLFIVDYLKASDRVPLERMKRLILREHELRHDWEIKPTHADIAGCATIEEVIVRLHHIYGAGKAHWGQKTPRFVRDLDLLAERFPDARFVHMIRDPRGVAASLKESPVHQSPVKYGAARWAYDVQCGLEFKNKAPERYLEVRFEAFAADPRAVVGEVCEFIGIEPAPEMFEVREVKGFKKKFFRTVHRRVGGNVRSDRADAWRESLTEAEIATVEAGVSELMQELGYQPEGNGRPLPELYSAGDRALRAVLQGAHYMLHRPGYLPCVVSRKVQLGLWPREALNLRALNR